MRAAATASSDNGELLRRALIHELRAALPDTGSRLKPLL